MTRLIRTLPFRMAVGFAAALAASSVAIFFYIYVETARLDQGFLGHYLEVEVQDALLLPEPELIDHVKVRQGRDFRHNTLEALFSAEGRLLAGNVAALPAGLPVDGRAHRIISSRLDDPEAGPLDAMAAAARRQDGSILMIGHGDDELIALQRVVWLGLERAMIPAALAALAFGIVFAVKSTERIKALHLTISRIMEGDLKERLPTTGTGDDLDSLTHRINEMLDEIVNLIGEIRSVGDNIAHDLRTPLSVIQSRLERAQREKDPDALRPLLDQCLSDLARTHGIITSLLRIAEIEHSRRLEFLGPTDLAELASEVHELYEPLAGDREIDFTVVTNGPAMILADRDMMIEAIANLVDNALKFSPQGTGKVVIAVGEEEGVPFLRVTDNGFGIPAAERSKVTQRYYRADKTHNARGSGLGLSLVAAITKLHGFTLRIGDVAQGAMVELICGPG